MRRSILLVLVLSSLVAGCTSTPAPGSARGSASSTATTQAPTTTPLADPAAARQAELEAEVDRALATLDQDAQLAQLFVVGVHLDELPTADPLVRDSQVGGIFLCGRSFAPAAELAGPTDRWKSVVTGPAPWLAADQEGGNVQTLEGSGFASLPSAREQGQMPPDQLAAVADGLGASLASAGVNLNLAPVADVVPAGTERRNAPIGAFARHYGHAAVTMTPAVQTVLDGMAAHGVTGTLKHFPGLGFVLEKHRHRARSSGHRHRPGPRAGHRVRAARPVTRRALRDDVVGHLRPDRPRHPAAFSHAAVTDLLRGRLGFTGVVISDDLGAALAVQALPPGQRAVRFLAAGGTLVLSVDLAVFPEMLAAVREQVAAAPQFAEPWPPPSTPRCWPRPAPASCPADGHLARPSSPRRGRQRPAHRGDRPPGGRGRLPEGLQHHGDGDERRHPRGRREIELALAVQARPQALRATVTLIRDAEAGWGPCIDERAAIANRAGADLLLSLHADRAGPGGHGFRVIMPGTLPGRTDDIAVESRRAELAVRDTLVVAGPSPANYVARDGLDERIDLGHPGPSRRLCGHARSRQTEQRG
jgi:beta-N-acetylhexosaminidase